MKVAIKLTLLTVVAGAGVVIGGWYLHRRYALQPFPDTTMNGTAGSDTIDLRYRLRTKLSATEKRGLFDGGCRVVTSADALPQPIKSAFSTVTQNRPFALANPGSRFNATDDVGPGLPQRRLVLAAVCNDRWIIQYERGGIGLSVVVMVLRLEPNGNVRFTWGGDSLDPSTSLGALEDAIVSGKFRDTARF
jgi:hypothetical protein